VARYFKFHSLADIDAECRKQNLNIQFSEDLRPLFRPVTVGGMRVGNSLCIQPMEGCDATLDGRPDELTLRRYRRFGAGGAKLIWAEATAVAPEGRATSRQLCLTEQNAPDFAAMLQQCRQAHREACGSDDDLVVGLQLTHSGRYSFPRRLIACHDPVLDPVSMVLNDAGKPSGRSIDATYPLLDDDYLRRLVDRYVDAARIAHRIGFQFVDVKQCHRYLLSELLAARTRPGPYGGSLENRTRLARDIIEAIRAAVPGLMIATRLNIYDCVPYRKKAGSQEGEPCPWQAFASSPGHDGQICAWGTNLANVLEPDLTEPIWWIGEMARLGVSLVNVSMGSPYTTPHVLRPFEYPPPDGYETPEHPLKGVERHFTLTGELQRRFPGLPIVGSGYSYLQEYLFAAGAKNLEFGQVAFVGVGRASLSQPDFARQLQEHGKLDRKRVCRTFSYCTALMRSKHNELGQYASGCPPFDKEVYGPIWDDAKDKG
jgi:2,4-dienoyl-CoA reductase-like NADH-dependent reductase (Old Yellow Enzyme family)